MASSLRAFALASVAAVAGAQTLPSFDVASIKPTPQDAKNGGYRFEPGGRMVANMFSLKNLIMVAWDLHDFQVMGGPAWLDTERFDVEARAEGSPSEEQGRVMLRELLKDRFGLKFHMEARDLPGYVLVQARGGAKLAPTKPGGCTPTEEEFPPAAEAGKAPYCGVRQRLLRQTDGAPIAQLLGSGVTLATLATFAGNVLDRPAADETGLTGNYDFDVRYIDSRLLQVLRRQGQPQGEGADAGPTLFTALEEQLGLKLEARKTRTQVLVVDAAQRPSAN